VRLGSYGVVASPIDWELCPLFTHPQVWAGIDKLAQQKGWSPSRLAREAGLDPTTFNKSKRHTNQAKPRWPSTESLAKILAATGTSLESFVDLMTGGSLGEEGMPSKRLRCLNYGDAANKGVFDESGFPTGSDWDEIDFPGIADKHTFAFEIQDQQLLPVYRDGDILIVSPSASVRRGDRVILKTTEGKLQAGVLVRRSAQRLEIDLFQHPNEKTTIPLSDVLWLSRIIWAKLGT
jgi:phage repressor protein C with HTH and peptisase S24 domain